MTAIQLLHTDTALRGALTASERKARSALGLTVLAAFGYLAAGRALGSHAAADAGWQLSFSAMALGLAVLSYSIARSRILNSARVLKLGGAINAATLFLVAAAVAIKSVDLLFDPTPVAFDDRVLAGAVALLIAMASAFLLKGGDRRDHNLRAVRQHVNAQVLLSALFLASLSIENSFGLSGVSAVAGFIAAVTIAQWASQLLHETFA